MKPSKDPMRAGLPMAAWPTADQLAWKQALVRCKGPFRAYGGGRRLSAPTLAKSEKGLQRWLGFLRRCEELDEAASPGERLSADRLDRYLAHLIDCGNSPRSIIGRFEELQLAMSLMYPDRNYGWLTKPEGVPLRQQFEMKVRSVFVPAAEDLVTWALELFEEGKEAGNWVTRCSQVRDALMIGLLSMLAPRQRALHSLKLDTHVYRVDAGWILDQTPEITKTSKALVLPIPEEVAIMLERYILVERQELLRMVDDGSLWISVYGGPLTVSGIVNMLWRRSMRRFGVSFSTHRFRKSLTTTNALESPDTPFDAAVILGHGPDVSLANYNLASGIAASKRYQALVKKLRAESEVRAHNAFRHRDRFRLS